MLQFFFFDCPSQIIVEIIVPAIGLGHIRHILFTAMVLNEFQALPAGIVIVKPTFNTLMLPEETDSFTHIYG